MDRVLRALADVTRRRILTLVWHGERTADQIAAEFPVSRPAISQHLSVLLTSELISVSRVGTRRLYRANRDALKRLRAQLGAFWDSRLEQLKDALQLHRRAFSPFYSILC